MTTKRSIPISLLLAAACLLSTVAPSQAYDPKAAFAETDANGDGAVDVGEFHQRIVDVFYGADADKDGFLTADELKQLPQPEKLEEVDKNGDGKASLREFMHVRILQFEEADTNHDGELSLEEVLILYPVKAK